VAEDPKQAPIAPPEQVAEESEPALDLASESLANALRLSFSILTFIIVFLLFTFLARGVFTVHEDEVAVVLRFGKTHVGLVKDKGLQYAFPYPLDQVVRIWTKPRKLEVNTFWPTIGEQQKTDAVEKEKELTVVAGAEGAYMLTGDLNILQARWDVTYRIRRDAQGGTDKASVIKYYNKIGLDEQYQYDDLKRYDNERLLIKLLLQSAVVHEVSRLGVFDAYPLGTTALSERVKLNMTRMLEDEDIDCGIVVTKITLIDLSPPMLVKPSFDAVLEAKNTSFTVQTDAISRANNTLIAAAGEVGPEMGEKLGEWWEARRAGDTAEMARLETVISELFESDKLGGKARTTITDALAYRKNIVTRTDGDADRLRQLAQRSPSERAIFLDRLRMEAIEYVMAGAYEKYMFRPLQGGAAGTLELWINRRAELLRKAREIQETR